MDYANPGFIYTLSLYSSEPSVACKLTKVAVGKYVPTDQIIHLCSSVTVIYYTM